MSKLTDKIAELKIEHPSIISTINDEQVELVGKDYEKAIENLAIMLLKQEEVINQAAADKLAKEQLLAKLGITEDEAKLLLG